MSNAFAQPSPAASVPRQTPRQGESSHPPPLHTPGALVLSERHRADLWKFISIAVCLASLLLSWLIVLAGRSGERIFVMDPSGNLHSGPAQAMADSRSFFHVTSLYAVNAALQRSPAGFDLYEMLGLYFTPRAVQKIEEDYQRRREDIRLRNLQQKPLIETVGEPVPAGDTRIVEVKGRLVSAGAYAGRTFYDEPPFTIVLTFRKNSDFSKAGAYPWVCEDFDLDLQDPPK
ncbi:MAG: hypothetical protein WC378_11215 [Opitutaceae bacterium]